MSQQASITLNSVVYVPAGVNNGIATWMNRTAGVIGGFSPLTEKFSTPTAASTQTKVEFRLSIPVVATADDSCACIGDVLRTSSASISFWLNQNSTLAERTDLYNRMVALMADAVVSNGVKNLDPAYG